MKNCYCGSDQLFSNCCEKFINKAATATTAEALMRSRYSAYCCANVDYLVQTTHATTRKRYSKDSLQEFATTNHWVKLEILATTATTVTFKAYYFDDKGLAQIHHEHSTFKQEQGSWYYVEGAYL
jgi:SEC-C motif domain protein